MSIDTIPIWALLAATIIIVMVACVGLVAFMRREIGLAVTAAAIALFLGLFVFAPHTAQSLIEGFWKRVA